MFGSFINETNSDDSDIDLFVELEKPAGWKFFSLLAMTWQLFDGMDVNPGIGQMGSEAMAQGTDFMPFCR